MVRGMAWHYNSKSKIKLNLSFMISLSRGIMNINDRDVEIKANHSEDIRSNFTDISQYIKLII